MLPSLCSDYHHQCDCDAMVFDSGCHYDRFVLFDTFGLHQHRTQFQANRSTKYVQIDFSTLNRPTVRINTLFLGRSPIFSHVNATLQGLATVRACNASKMLEKEFHEFQDRNTSCYFLFNGASRWFALWLDVISLLFSAVVTYSFLVLGNGE